MKWACWLLPLSLGLSCLGVTRAAGERDSNDPFARLQRDEFLPQPAAERWLRIDQPETRGDAVRRFVHDHLSVVSPQAFDLLNALGTGSRSPLLRGAKFGLFTGAVAFTATEMAGGDSWLAGSLALAGGFAGAATSRLNWPPTFTVRYGRNNPFTASMGWLTKPAYLPRNRALAAWRNPTGPNTAGASLKYRPSPRSDAVFEVFADPFATPGDSYGGAQFHMGF